MADPNELNWFQQGLSGLLGGAAQDPTSETAQQARMRGLLTTGLGLLAASGPSYKPHSLGQDLAQGLMAGRQGYQGVFSQAEERRQQALEKRAQQMQMQQMMRKRKAAQRKQQMASGILGNMGQGQGPGAGDLNARELWALNQRLPGFSDIYQDVHDTPAWRQKFAMYQQSPAYRQYVNGTTGGTTVNVSLPGKQPISPLMKEVLGGQADEFLKDQQAAQRARSTLNTLQRSRKLLNDAYTGFGANWVAGLGEVLHQAGFSVDTDAIAATQAFAANQARVTMNLLQNLGRGSGISDEDRQFAERAAGGDVTMNKQAIERLLDIQEQAAKATIRQYNRKASALQNTSGGVPWDITVPIPAEQPQQATGPSPSEQSGNLQRMAEMVTGALGMGPSGAPTPNAPQSGGGQFGPEVQSLIDKYTDSDESTPPGEATALPPRQEPQVQQVPAQQSGEFSPEVQALIDKYAPQGEDQESSSGNSPYSPEVQALIDKYAPQ